MATQVASLFGTLSLDDRDFKRGLDGAEKGMRGLGASLQDIGGRISGVGQALTVATAPLGGALAFATRESQKFSREFSNVQAVMGITGDEARALREEILALGGDTVAGPQANMSAFYDIVSAGITDTATALEVLTTANAVAEAGQADLGATTSAVISTMNAYGLEAEDAARVGDIFNRSVQMGVLRMDELASAFPQVTGLAAQFGLEAENMAAALSFMTTQGFSASQSSTFLRSMITTLINPTADLEEAITALGYESGQSLIETEGLVGAYQLLAEQNGTLAGLITNQEALTGGLLLTKDAADEFLQAFIDGIDGATEAAGAIQDETAGFDKLQSKLSELAITVGDELSPVLLELVDETIIPLVESIIDWTKENPELTKTLLKVAGGALVLGPALVAVGTVVSSVGTLFNLARGAANLLSGASGLGGLLLRVVPLTAAIAGLIHVAGNMYPGGWAALLSDAAREAQELIGYVGELATIIGTNLNTAIDNMIQKLMTFLGLGEDATNKVKDLVDLDTVGDVASGLAQGPAGAFNGINGLASDVGTDLGLGLRDWFDGLFGASTNSVSNSNTTINVTQRPGESGDDLAKRIVREMARA